MADPIPEWGSSGHHELLDERQRLLDKKFAATMTTIEDDRLAWVRERLDAIDEVRRNTNWSSQRHARPDCPKCHGSGSYLYDDNHGKPCELCCPHDQGWWLLEEHYGDRNGRWCCGAGCGETRDRNPNVDV